MRVGVIFGGRSCEHDVSVITGVSVVNAVMVKHDAIPIYIDHNGEWLIGNNFHCIDTFLSSNIKGKRVHLRPSSNAIYSSMGRKIAVLDVIILCVHGANGEDGALAGLLNLSSIPYAGSGILASSVGMDKIIQKRIFRDAGYKVTNFCELNKFEMTNKNPDNFYNGIDKIKQLNFPLFVKPANLGSSIGIGKAKDYLELFERIDLGFLWDNRLIIEEALEDFIELNCAVLGYGDKLLASVVEQPLTNEYLSYDDKYLTSPKKGNTGRFMPAHIDESMNQLVIQTSKEIFSLLSCSGVARVDYLIKDNELYVNEINTIPGSLASYLFAFDGLDFTQLIDKLIDIALAIHSQKSSLKYKFNSKILQSNLKSSK